MAITPTSAGNNPIINPLSTLETDPVRNFKFLVTFEPTSGDQASWGSTFGKLGFVSVSGLSVSTEPIAYREGGYNTNMHQLPGMTSFTPITLSKGIMVGGGNDVHAKWMKRLFSVLTPQPTGVGSNFRVNVGIQVLSHPNPGAFAGSDSATAANGAAGQHSSMRFKIFNAWITSLTYSNLDAGSNSLMVEEMTLVHEGFDVSFSTGYDVNGSAPDWTATGSQVVPQ